jgi:oligopeptide transport system ATP-binding protein
MKPILTIRKLQKYYGSGNNVVKAIDNVSFQVYPGKVTGLIGESGSGKTTIGRTIIRLIEDFGGLMILDKDIISGKKLSKAKQKVLRQKIQMIFQDPMSSLNGQKNVSSILKEPLITNG